MSMNYIHKNNIPKRYRKTEGAIFQPHNSETNLLHFPGLSSVYESKGTQVCYNSDITVLIPKGRRCLFWFTTKDTQNVCYVIECMHVNGNSDFLRRSCKSFIIQTCFATELCYGVGTILRGTYCNIKGSHLGAVEDIYYYKGKNIQKQPLVNRLQLLTDVFKYEIQQFRYFKNQVILSVCIVVNGNTSPSSIVNTVNTLPYPVKFIQFRYDNRGETPVVNVDAEEFAKYAQLQDKRIQRSGVSKMRYNDIKNIEVPDMVFTVKPDIQNDVYRLYSYTSTGELIFYGYAGIQCYETSVMMNKLFRKIKENDNLDALEESDDEEDFENVDEDKYVKLDAVYNMVCTYMPRINKWLPQKVVGKGKEVSNIGELNGYGRANQV